jgi:hypothetical protein
MTATLCCFPLDVLRTRILSMPSGQQAGSPLGMLARIAHTEGIAALYVGCVPALVAMAPGGAIYYWMYDVLKERHLKATGEFAGALQLI